MCKIWWHHNGLFFFFKHQHRVQCFHWYNTHTTTTTTTTTTHTHTLTTSVFIDQTGSRPVPDCKMLGKDDCFPNGAETPWQTFSCNDVWRLLLGEGYPAKLPKFVKLLRGLFSILIYSYKEVQGISVWQNNGLTQYNDDWLSLSLGCLLHDW